MKKAECETAIRSLATKWARETGVGKSDHPSFSSFKTWLRETGYAGYLYFRSIAGHNYDAEAWFDDELGQNWRR